MRKTQNKRRFPAICLILLPFVLVITYGPFRGAPFAYDDHPHILENPEVTSFTGVLDAKATKQLFQGRFGLQGRPLLFLTYGMNYAASGASATGFHLTNFTLHLANSFLVLLIVYELARTRFPNSAQPGWLALLAALLFAVHPLLTESITYIAGRSSSLCAVFYFTALYCVLRSGHEQRLGQMLLLATSLAATVGALLVKQDAIALPAAAIAMVWLGWPRSVPSGSRWMTTGLWICVPIIILSTQTATLRAISATTQSNDPLVVGGYDPTLPIQPYVLTSIKEFTFYYLWRFLLPVKLTVDPEVGVVVSPLSATFVVSLLILCALMLLIVFYRSRQPILASGVALLLFSPLSAYCFFPLADVVAEHRAYISALGAVIIIGDLLFRSTRTVLLSTAVVLAFSALTIQRNTVWSNETSLWMDASQKAPNKLRPHLNLAAVYVSSGRPDQAIEEYRIVLNRKPDNESAIAGLASVYIAQNDIRRAEELLEPAVARQTRFAPVYVNLAVVRVRQGRLGEVKDLLDQGLALNPGLANIHHNLGNLAFNQNQPQRAIEEYLAELRLNPNSVMTHLQIARAYEATGQKTQSLRHYEIVLHSQPRNLEVLAAIQRLKSL